MSNLGVQARWMTPVFLALAQLMIALDATIMNVALPSLQSALGFADDERQWVIASYTVAVGSLLLLGGRLSDRIGHRLALTIGLFGFAAVSALGGMSGSLVALCLARAAQGAFAALLAPTALALVAAHAQATGERAKTFALFGAIAGSGGVVGLVLGGYLTSRFGWRVCMWINVPIALIAVLGTRRIELRGAARSAGLDLPGALLAACSIGTLVFACSRASAGGDLSSAFMLLTAALLLMAAFVWHERRAHDPLLPARIWRDRQRAGAYVSAGLAVAGMLGLFLSLTYYFQVVRHYTPLQAGLAFLPLSAAVFVSAQIVARLLPRFGERNLIVAGLAIASGAMLQLGQLTMSTSYAAQLLPAELLLGVGMGAVFTPAISAATARVARADAGVAAALVQSSQQIGGAIGVTVLNAVAAAAAIDHSPAALVAGYGSATRVAAIMLAIAAVLTAWLMSQTRGQAVSGAHQ
ncbi:MAG TPA: MFS transporter [Polyangiales bacterium]|nr:MFS transporter [Polyangiales bacterium]